MQKKMIFIVGTGSYVGRSYGRKYSGAGPSQTALSSITVNGSTVTSSDPASASGLDITSANLLVSTTYTNRSFNFSNEALDYIWELYGASARFREGTG